MDGPKHRVCIRIAGNTDNPALLALRAKGYRVWLDYLKVTDPRNPWFGYMPDYQAEKDGAYFSAINPAELLGLVTIWEIRGDNWKYVPGVDPNVLDELRDLAKVFEDDDDDETEVADE